MPPTYTELEETLGDLLNEQTEGFHALCQTLSQHWAKGFGRTQNMDSLRILLRELRSYAVTIRKSHAESQKILRMVQGMVRDKRSEIRGMRHSVMAEISK